MNVGPQRRFLVFKRDSFTCQYCGRKSPEAELECDHVIPRARGGSDEAENLITSCYDCNRGKRTTSVLPGSSVQSAIEKLYPRYKWTQEDETRLLEMRAIPHFDESHFVSYIQRKKTLIEALDLGRFWLLTECYDDHYPIFGSYAGTPE